MDKKECINCIHAFCCHHFGNGVFCKEFVDKGYIRKLEGLLNLADKDDYFGINGWKGAIGGLK